MVDGDPCLTELTFLRPMPPGDLAKIDWLEVAWDAVKVEAFRQVDPAGDVADQFRGLRAVDTAAETARRYNRVRNREQLEQVADAWRVGGPSEVERRFTVGRRQADRYVRRAREAGLL